MVQALGTSQSHITRRDRWKEEGLHFSASDLLPGRLLFISEGGSWHTDDHRIKYHRTSQAQNILIHWAEINQHDSSLIVIFTTGSRAFHYSLWDGNHLNKIICKKFLRRSDYHFMLLWPRFLAKMPWRREQMQNALWSLNVPLEPEHDFLLQGSHSPLCNKQNWLLPRILQSRIPNCMLSELPFFGKFTWAFWHSAKAVYVSISNSTEKLMNCTLLHNFNLLWTRLLNWPNLGNLYFFNF